MLTAYKELKDASPLSLLINFSVTFYNEPGITKV